MQNLVILLDPVCQFLHDPERIFSLAQDTQSLGLLLFAGCSVFYEYDQKCILVTMYPV